MNFNFNSLDVLDFIFRSYYNLEALSNLESCKLNSPNLNLRDIELKANIYWVWLPKSNNNRISTFVYKFYNGRNIEEYYWKG